MSCDCYICTQGNGAPDIYSTWGSKYRPSREFYCPHYHMWSELLHASGRDVKTCGLLLFENTKSGTCPCDLCVANPGGIPRTWTRDLNYFMECVTAVDKAPSRDCYHKLAYVDGSKKVLANEIIRGRNRESLMEPVFAPIYYSRLIQKALMTEGTI